MRSRQRLIIVCGVVRLYVLTIPHMQSTKRARRWPSLERDAAVSELSSMDPKKFDNMSFALQAFLHSGEQDDDLYKDVLALWTVLTDAHTQDIERLHALVNRHLRHANNGHLNKMGVVDGRCGAAASGSGGFSSTSQIRCRCATSGNGRCKGVTGAGPAGQVCEVRSFVVFQQMPRQGQNHLRQGSSSHGRLLEERPT